MERQYYWSRELQETFSALLSLDFTGLYSFKLQLLKEGFKEIMKSHFLRS